VPWHPGKVYAGLQPNARAPPLPRPLAPSVIKRKSTPVHSESDCKNKGGGLPELDRPWGQLSLVLHWPDEAQGDKVTRPRLLSQLTAEWDPHPLPRQCSFLSQHSDSPIPVYSQYHFPEECGSQLQG